MNKQEELTGLGGWLILVGIGVILSPITLLVDGYALLEFFKEGGGLIYSAIQRQKFIIPVCYISFMPSVR